MTAFMYAKAIESITDFGFIDPITCTSDYTIIDGEHRWRAARDLGFTDVPVSVLDGLSEPEYRKLTIVLNGTKTVDVKDDKQKSGAIGLQYGTTAVKDSGIVKFRKVEIKPL